MTGMVNVFLCCMYICIFKSGMIKKETEKSQLNNALILRSILNISFECLIELDYNYLHMTMASTLLVLAANMYQAVRLYIQTSIHTFAYKVAQLL